MGMKRKRKRKMKTRMAGQDEMEARGREWIDINKPVVALTNSDNAVNVRRWVGQSQGKL